MKPGDAGARGSVKGGRAARLAILISAELFSGCASTSMLSVDRSPDFRNDQVRRVLVIGQIKDQALRKAFEAEFVRQWSAYGVSAFSSLEALPPTTPLTKVAIAPIARAQGYDTVFVTRLLNRKTIAAGEPASPYVVPDSGGDVQKTNTALQVLLAPPVYVNDYDLATVESNLYNVASEQRVWSAVSETKEVRRFPKLISPFVKLILKRLYERPG